MQATNAVITISGVRLLPHREGFLSDPMISERLLDDSLQNAPAYRRDLMMLATGDLFSTQQPHFTSRDFREVGGLVNYAQAITHRLMTTRGTHPEDISFGVPWDRYIGTYVSERFIIPNLTADITEEVMKDSRTESVASVTINFTSNSVVEVVCELIPIFNQGGSVEVALTVAGAP